MLEDDPELAGTGSTREGQAEPEPAPSERDSNMATSQSSFVKVEDGEETGDTPDI